MAKEYVLNQSWFWKRRNILWSATPTRICILLMKWDQGGSSPSFKPTEPAEPAWHKVENWLRAVWSKQKFTAVGWNFSVCFLSMWDARGVGVWEATDCGFVQKRLARLARPPRPTGQTCPATTPCKHQARPGKLRYNVPMYCASILLKVLPVESPGKAPPSIVFYLYF